jgi:cholesterol transport system auxiliary component
MKRSSLWLALALMLTACIVPEPAVRPATYDFGSTPVPLVNSPAPSALGVADLQAPRWLDGSYIYYRLHFANAQELKPYANSRWTMPPSQLILQRLKNRLSQNVSVVAAGDVAGDPLLKVELDGFEQVFSSKDASLGVVRLRASLIHNHRLVAQKLFAAERPAPTADAPGGVQALTQATDAALDDMAAWVVEQLALPK